MRDNATDLPSFDYFCKSELSGLQQLPEAFVFHEDLSSSAFSSDKSAGQVSDSLKSRIRTTISIARDGSAQFVPCETVKLSEFIEKSLKSAFTCNSSTPHVSGSLWRPSSRRLRLEEVDISTSEDSNSLEVVSVGMAKRCAYNQADSRSMTRVWDSAKTEFSTGLDGSDSELLAKESSDSSHQDDDHTYNQVSQITSE
ncbi:hypothetical protein DICVIV_00585 [Dictyocaulus viviparus]|uniref:Uncharacterized protein n=1 Tax=Dictyocaulus viviparus TaxID=29172 RepID=A0A0D8YB86_DICVI|nr:hypothetical protein DICVIV_00585 [Dictyocaulus viviparus]